MRKIWVITGASRGMGTDFAKAALAADHAVVATGLADLNAQIEAYRELSTSLALEEPALAGRVR